MLPGADPEEIINRFNDYAEGDVLKRMRAVFPGANIETKVRAQSPGLAALDGDPGETLVMNRPPAASGIPRGMSRFWE